MNKPTEEEIKLQIAKNLAAIDWKDAGSLSDNPYEEGSKEYDVYMMTMARLQNDNFRDSL